MKRSNACEYRLTLLVKRSHVKGKDGGQIIGQTKSQSKRKSQGGRPTNLVEQDIARDPKENTKGAKEKKKAVVKTPASAESIKSARSKLWKLLVENQEEGIERPELIGKLCAKNVPLDLANAALDCAIEENHVFVMMDLHFPL